MAIIKNPITIINSESSVPTENLVEFADQITEIPENSFNQNFTIKSITLPDTVETIGDTAFWCCDCLETVVLPESVEYIGDFAFQDCHSLTSVTVLATTPPGLGRDVFTYINDDCVIYVPSSALSDYLEDWSQYEDMIQAIPS